MSRDLHICDLTVETFARVRARIRRGTSDAKVLREIVKAGLDSLDAEDATQQVEAEIAAEQASSKPKAKATKKRKAVK